MEEMRESTSLVSCQASHLISGNPHPEEPEGRYLVSVGTVSMDLLVIRCYSHCVAAQQSFCEENARAPAPADLSLGNIGATETANANENRDVS